MKLLIDNFAFPMSVHIGILCDKLLRYIKPSGNYLQWSQSAFCFNMKWPHLLSEKSRGQMPIWRPWSIWDDSKTFRRAEWYEAGANLWKAITVLYDRLVLYVTNRHFYKVNFLHIGWNMYIWSQNTVIWYSIVLFWGNCSSYEANIH